MRTAALAPVGARGSAVSAAVLVVVINVLAWPLRTGAAPLGLISLQFAPDVDAAASILASWSAVPRVRLLVAHGLDLVLPVAYGLAIVRASAAARPRAPRAARLAAGAGVLAAAADQVENLAMAASILEAPTARAVAVTRAAATVKWPALAAALLVVAVLAVRARPTGGPRA